MEDRFVRLHEHGYPDEQELAHARLLLVRVRKQDAERRARQAARPADAPRAYLSEGAGAVIARLFLPFAIAGANAPEDDATAPMRQAVAEMRAKLDAEDERLLEELRAALDDADQLP